MVERVCTKAHLVNFSQLLSVTICGFLYQALCELEVYARYRGPVSGSAEGIY